MSGDQSLYGFESSICVIWETHLCFVEIEKELEKTDTKKIPILQSSKKRSVTDGDPMVDGGQMSAGMSCYLSKCIYLFFMDIDFGINWKDINCIEYQTKYVLVVSVEISNFSKWQKC